MVIQQGCAGAAASSNNRTQLPHKGALERTRYISVTEHSKSNLVLDKSADHSCHTDKICRYRTCLVLPTTPTASVYVSYQLLGGPNDHIIYLHVWGRGQTPQHSISNVTGLQALHAAGHCLGRLLVTKGPHQKEVCLHKAWRNARHS